MFDKVYNKGEHELFKVACKLPEYDAMLSGLLQRTAIVIFLNKTSGPAGHVAFVESSSDVRTAMTKAMNS